jgi:hypothetical protein
MSSVVDDKTIRFLELSQNKPMPGDILTSVDGEKVKVHRDVIFRDDGTPREVYYVNCAIDVDTSGWYLTSRNRGLKALILPLSLSLLQRHCFGEKLQVKRLSVVRINEKHTALYCEILPEDLA